MIKIHNIKIHGKSNEFPNENGAIQIIKIGNCIKCENIIAETKMNLNNKLFVITGILEGFSRLEATALIEKHGGKVTGSVSKNTDYLVLGENPGSKLDKAFDLDIPIIEIDDLVKMCKD